MISNRPSDSPCGTTVERRFSKAETRDGDSFPRIKRSRAIKGTDEIVIKNDAYPV